MSEVDTAREPKTVTITIDGVEVRALEGETVAAALARAGITAFRETRTGASRGIYCGMGVCQDCLVTVDGVPNLRACMTKVIGPHALARQEALAAPASVSTQAGARVLVERNPEVLIVGAGAGGLTAATAAAEAGAEVVVIDERPKAGGQYYKQPADMHSSLDEPGADRQFEGGRQLIARARAAGVTFLAETLVWGAFAPLELAALSPGESMIFRPRKLIVAAGAYERAFPFPGWTLPGVMTTGAAQTLLRSYRVPAGARILIAGNGPLNLQVAIELARAGARVSSVVEAASRPGLSTLRALAAMTLNDSRLMRDGLSYLAAARKNGISLDYGRIVVGVRQTPEGLVATTAESADPRRDSREHPPVDVVCTNYGFLPSNEVLRTLGARHDYDPERRQLVTVRNPQGLTSLPDLYAVGDCCGLGGAPAAREEGLIAGAAAAEALGHALPRALVENVAGAHRRLVRHRAFQSALWELYASPAPPDGVPDADTLLCRCEEVSRGTIDAVLDGGCRTLGDLKRRTRAGMGRCQGRYCAPLLAERLARHTGQPLDEMAFFAPRVPFKPIALGDVAAPADAPAE
jgi:D-hydroxyproline dehydrogenase subunit alpha